MLVHEHFSTKQFTFAKLPCRDHWSSCSVVGRNPPPVYAYDKRHFHTLPDFTVAVKDFLPKCKIAILCDTSVLDKTVTLHFAIQLSGVPSIPLPVSNMVIIPSLWSRFIHTSSSANAENNVYSCGKTSSSMGVQVLHSKNHREEEPSQLSTHGSMWTFHLAQISLESLEPAHVSPKKSHAASPSRHSFSPPQSSPIEQFPHGQVPTNLHRYLHFNGCSVWKVHH